MATLMIELELPAETVQQLQAKAERQHLPLTDMVRVVIQEYLAADLNAATAHDETRPPSPSELLAMPEAEREYWIQRSFELAAGEDFERFDAFGEEQF